MQERVLLLRVLHDGVVMRVLRTNAVLQCTMPPAAMHNLRQDMEVTVRVAAYNAPFLCVTVQEDAGCPRSSLHGAHTAVTCLHAGAACERRKRRHFGPLHT